MYDRAISESEGKVGCPLKRFKPPPPPSNLLLTFQGGSFVVVLCYLIFGIRVSVTFYLTCVVRFGLVSGHLLGNSCSLG